MLFNRKLFRIGGRTKIEVKQIVNPKKLFSQCVTKVHRVVSAVVEFCLEQLEQYYA